MIRALFAVALAAVPSPAVPQTFTNSPVVRQVICNEGKGTAFFAGGKVISVAHVTNNAGCTMDGLPLNATQEGAKDFSTAPGIMRGYKVNCDGFKAGEYYHAIGFAGGRPFQRVLTVRGTGQYHPNGMAILLGWPTYIPGMSGGVVLNDRAEAVGTVNMFNVLYPLSFSEEMKGTSLCA